MNRNSTKIAVLVCLLFVAAALVGCGGGAETQNHNPNPQPEAGDVGSDTDANAPDVQPEAEPDAKEAGNDTGMDAPDADVPDTQPEAEPDADAKPDADCEHSVCDPCSPEGLLCGDLICWEGLWAMNSDSGISHAGCPQIDAGPDADADVPDVQPEAEPDADVDGGQVQETGTFDAPPPPPEVCDNNADDDGDGKKDCEDPDCYQAVNCKIDVCNGLDDNNDGIVDNGPGMECAGVAGNSQSCVFMCGSTPLPGTQSCNTSTCKWNACAKVAVTESNCSDGLDNDCDGQVDCADYDCQMNFIGCQSEICNNGVDDNGDDQADCNDPQCANHITCVCEPPQVGWDCLYAGAYHPCDPAYRCDCSFKWNYSSAPGAFTCQIGDACNGLDDNGNGAVDEPFACVYNTTTQCVTTCGSIGSQYCNLNCQPQACQPPPENCSDGLDNDCDGKKDCEDPDCALAPNCQVSEICNALDDNNDGIVDNGPGMECAGTPNNTRSCVTACGSQGVQACNTSTCQWNACVTPVKETKCGDGKDDDCDGYVDCADSDCWGTAVCPHNFGTCGSVQLTGDALNCSAWSTQQLSKRVLQGCAFSDSDQWVVTGDYDQIEVMRKTTGTWTAVPIPVPGKPEGTSITCVQNNVYLVYNQHNAPQGSIVLAKWTGSQFQRLNTPSAEGYASTTAWAFDASNVWIFGVRWSGEQNTVVFKWNGTTLVKTPYLEGDDRTFYVTRFYATGTTNVYAAGYDRHRQTSVETAVLTHWDGVSWARMSTPVFPGAFMVIHGTSACDVMVGGFYAAANQDAQAVSFQRNGSSWVSQTYPGYEAVYTAMKVSPWKYLLGVHYYQAVDRWAAIGASNGNGSMTWTFPHGDFIRPLVSWQVPGTSTFMVAGEGNDGYISSASCQ